MPATDTSRTHFKFLIWYERKRLPLNLPCSLADFNTGEIDLNLIAKMTSGFTPADVEYLFQQVAQFAFEHEYGIKQDYQVTTETFQHIVPKIRPSLADEVIKEFQKDSITYSRT